MAPKRKHESDSLVRTFRRLLKEAKSDTDVLDACRYARTHAIDLSVAVDGIHIFDAVLPVITHRYIDTVDEILDVLSDSGVFSTGRDLELYLQKAECVPGLVTIPRRFTLDAGAYRTVLLYNSFEQNWAERIIDVASDECLESSIHECVPDWGLLLSESYNLFCRVISYNYTTALRKLMRRFPSVSPYGILLSDGTTRSMTSYFLPHTTNQEMKTLVAQFDTTIDHYYGELALRLESYLDEPLYGIEGIVAIVLGYAERPRFNK